MFIYDSMQGSRPIAVSFEQLLAIHIEFMQHHSTLLWIFIAVERDRDWKSTRARVCFQKVTFTLTYRAATEQLFLWLANHMNKQKVKITLPFLWSLVGFNGFSYHAITSMRNVHVVIILSTEYHLTTLFPLATDLFVLV